MAKTYIDVKDSTGVDRIEISDYEFDIIGAALHHLKLGLDTNEIKLIDFPREEKLFFKELLKRLDSLFYIEA